MKLHFYKYQGAGNDFIIVDGRNHDPELSEKEISSLCRRRFGIGADGLMILGSAPQVDFSMRYYNSDGKAGSMCGNGGRCLVACAARLGIAPSMELNRYLFSAVDGIHHAEVVNKDQICLKMNNVNKVQAYGKDGFFLDTGSPHLVIFGTEINKMEVAKRGAFWRNHPDFAPEGTNVNFVEIDPDNRLFVRTFERGVEEETLACGTGATAAAIAAYIRTKKTNTYNIQTPGGYLRVSFKIRGTQFYDIHLTGPATCVFEGDIEL
ncbi:MAG: diaminopimelate epimerase [Bacteroidetes bacterium]|nr:diaminopimelate epimerase [Bacteroidota bacterium]